MPLDVGITETSAVVNFYVHAQRQGWVRKFTNLFKSKNKVLVLGSTGTGKTNMVKSISDSVPNAIDSMDRSEFVREYKVSIENNPFVFIDTPGQRGHKTKRVRKIREAMSDDISGIINVVSYGYHEYRTEESDAFEKNGRVDEGFLKRHRQIEIEALDEWTSLLGSPQTIDWIITVVAKADLWWDQKDQVIKHYSEGRYHESLGDAKSLSPSVLEYCSVFHKFFQRGALSGEFDDRQRFRARQNLLRKLLSSAGLIELQLQ